MQVNSKEVLVILPTRDSQLFSSLHHSSLKSIMKVMTIKFNSELANVRSMEITNKSRRY